MPGAAVAPETALNAPSSETLPAVAAKPNVPPKPSDQRAPYLPPPAVVVSPENGSPFGEKVVAPIFTERPSKAFLGKEWNSSALPLTV